MSYILFFTVRQAVKVDHPPTTPLKDTSTFYKYPLYNFKDGYEILIALIMISKTKSA